LVAGRLISGFSRIYSAGTESMECEWPSTWIFFHLTLLDEWKKNFSSSKANKAAFELHHALTYSA
jgi:hypothetical protein